MKIGFLAMSGVRAHDLKLLELGLTLPGFVERSKVIASLPSLGLLYLAAVTPPGHELRYFEAEADGKEPAELYTCDLVAISTFSAQIFEAYAIADRLRATGVKVAMGGLHVSVLPNEALAHADFVIVGEGEGVWSTIVELAQSNRNPPQWLASSRDRTRARREEQSHGRRSLTPTGTLAPADDARGIFRARDFPSVDVAQLPIPRYDLLDPSRYNRFTVQTSRGCPWRCDFCASTVMLSQRYRKRPVEHVIRDIRAIQRLCPNAFIEFADDNTFVDKRWGRELCRAMIPLRVKWFTETDISVADDPQLLELMREAGCRQLLIGLESPSRQPLEGIELHANAKAKWHARYAEAIRVIQAAGITMNGCFILGLDGHTSDIFPQVLEFACDRGLYEVQITVLTAFPGTPLYERLRREGRIIEPGRWDLCTLFDVNHHPRGMSAQELREGMYWLAERLYGESCVALRRRSFFHQCRHRAVA